MKQFHQWSGRDSLPLCKGLGKRTGVSAWCRQSYERRSGEADVAKMGQEMEEKALSQAANSGGRRDGTHRKEETQTPGEELENSSRNYVIMRANSQGTRAENRSSDGFAEGQPYGDLLSKKTRSIKTDTIRDSGGQISG